MEQSKNPENAGDLIYFLVAIIFYSFIFLFLLYIIRLVIRIEVKKDKIILTMLVCLAISMFACIIAFIYRVIIWPNREIKKFNDCLNNAAYNYCPYMFRNIAFLMNSAKWSYLILVARTHRKIRRSNFLSESKRVNEEETQTDSQVTIVDSDNS